MRPQPAVLIEMAPKIVPSLILLFDGLKRAYAAKAQADAEEEESESEDGDVGEGWLFLNWSNLKRHIWVFSDILSSDEDEIDDQGQDYLESLVKKAVTAGESKGRY